MMCKQISFQSGEKIKHHTKCLSCSIIKKVNGHWTGLPSDTVSVFRNFKLKFLVISECSGAKKRADK